MFRKLGWAAAVVVGFGQTLAMGAQGGFFNPPPLSADVDVGAGLEEDSVSGPGVMLRVSVLVTDPDKREPVRLDDWARAKSFMYIARLNGSLTVNWAGDVANIPSFDIDVVPFELALANRGLETSRRSGSQREMIQMEFGPSRIFRNVVGDQSFAVRVSVIGMELDTKLPLSSNSSQVDSKVFAFASVAADAVGLKVVSHVSELGTFGGLHVAGVTASTGVAWVPSDRFAIRMILGGTADLNVGHNGAGFAAQSDVSAFAKVKADIGRLLQLFVEGRGIKPLESGDSFARPELRVVAGGSILF